MKIIVYEKQHDHTMPSLWDGICHICPDLQQAGRPLVLALTGAGGKTSCIEQLAAEFSSRGRRVLVVTTTHMYEPKAHGLLTDDAEAIIERLHRDGLVIAGPACGNGKIGYIGDAAYAKAAAAADVVLVEADGARRLPLKVMGLEEPVLPDRCDAILCVAGLAALGKPLQDACFRWQEAQAAARRFGKSCPDAATDGDAVLTVGLFAGLWQSGCLSGLEENVPILPILNQADTPQLQIAANFIFQEIGIASGLITSFRCEEEERCG